MDGACFPQNRRPSADTWATRLGHHTLVRTRSSEVTGYGVIQPTARGYRISPLVVENEPDALAPGRPIALARCYAIVSLSYG